VSRDRANVHARALLCLSTIARPPPQCSILKPNASCDKRGQSGTGCIVRHISFGPTRIFAQGGRARAVARGFPFALIFGRALRLIRLGLVILISRGLMRRARRTLYGRTSAGSVSWHARGGANRPWRGTRARLCRPCRREIVRAILNSFRRDEKCNGLGERGKGGRGGTRACSTRSRYLGDVSRSSILSAGTCLPFTHGRQKSRR
jgi:hypothetical protein